jgi:transposase-like protein
MSEYQIIERLDSEKLAEYLSQEGQFLLPMLSLIEQAEVAVDEVIDVVGRASIEAVLLMSARQVAGVKQKGKRREDEAIGWHGKQKGVVAFSDRKMRIKKPRLRRKGQSRDAEVEIPAYTAMQTSSRLGQRMLQIILAGISTRKYKEVLPQMAEAVGVSRSSVSRETIEASEEVFEKLLERRFDDKDILIVYIDGLRFGDYHVLAAVGVDSEGFKHVLGIKEGASENAAVVKELLLELVDKGITPGRRRLFVIDGSKPLRIGIDTVYGSDNPVQRCRNHKERNLQDHLPREQSQQVVSAMKAAWRMEAKEGEAKLEQLAKWLEQEWPSAAASLREGLPEMFTVNRLRIPPTLRRCLGSTNVIESSFSGARGKTSKVTHWQNGAMALRWAASSLMATEKNFRKIMGAHQLWQLKAYLDEPAEKDQIENRRKVG